MPRLEPPGGTIERAYAAGDPWTADAASSLANPSLAFYEAALREHDDDGPHDTARIARVAALVTYSGGSYSISAGYNTSSVSALATGKVKLDHSLTLLAHGWGARVEAQAKDEPVFGLVVDTTATTSVTVQLVDRTGAAIDCSFWVEVWEVLR